MTKKHLVGEVGDNVFSMQNMRSAWLVLAGVGVNGLSKFGGVGSLTALVLLST